MVRIACVSYLNTLPLVAGLDKLGGVTIIPTVPAKIGAMVAAGEADVGLASIVDAATLPLAFLPCGMIGCDGPTLTVRLFSRVPQSRIERLAADTESHTSVILCRLVLDRLHGVRPAVTGLEGGHDAVLLIGDKVVSGAPDSREYPYQLDLGEEWKRLTGLPFVYALWACREGEGDSHRVRLAAEILDRQRRRNAMRLDSIVERHAESHGWPADLARRYVRDLLRYDLGGRERLAVSRFFQEAGDAGFLSPAAPRWVEVAEPALA